MAKLVVVLVYLGFASVVLWGLHRLLKIYLDRKERENGENERSTGIGTDKPTE